MKSEVSVSLTLTGIDLEPEKITEEIGIKPSEIWRKGELVDPRAIIRYKENGWRLLSPLENSNRIADPNDLEILTRSLLEKLQPVWDNVVKTCSQYYTELNCVIYVSDQVPAIHFDADILEKLQQLNAAIDVDLYVLPEPEEEEIASESVANPVPIEPPKQEVTIAD